MRGDVAVVESDRLIVVREGRRRLIQFLQERGSIGVGQREVRIQRYGLVVARNRRGRVIEFLEYSAAVVAQLRRRLARGVLAR